ncbi:hypothetical protein B0H15DRAFT_850905 [Mycena belliarum]|uniref:Uncharacterized protein n=1 Tax=Mycena belliarum TaxID=1033014 RepID=A0AAD6XJR1_9AGAR|nr:hypothetical protein B0H15DRAFT_850905 [Mycena belliae]
MRIKSPQLLSPTILVFCGTLSTAGLLTNYEALVPAGLPMATLRRRFLTCSFSEKESDFHEALVGKIIATNFEQECEGPLAAWMVMH